MSEYSIPHHSFFVKQILVTQQMASQWQDNIFMGPQSRLRVIKILCSKCPDFTVQIAVIINGMKLPARLPPFTQWVSLWL